jgi:hypothetical protein
LGVSSTGAFTQFDGDRAFAVSTASDENALLKIEGLNEDKIYTEGTNGHTATISNRFNETLSIENIKTAGSSGDNEWLKITQVATMECPSDQSLDAYSGSSTPDCHSFTIEIPEELKKEDGGNGNPGNGNGNPGNGNGNPGNGNPNPNKNAKKNACDNAEGDVPFCDKEVSDTIIIRYSGPETTIELNRKITLTP